MSEFFKIRLLDVTDSNRIWLGRTRINYNPVFIECNEKSFVIAVEKKLLKSIVLSEYLQDRCYDLVPVEPSSVPKRRLYTDEDDWYR